MATKKKKLPKSKPRAPKADRHEEWLLGLIAVSESNATAQGTSIDDLFAQQAARIRAELAEYRAKK